MLTPRRAFEEYSNKLIENINKTDWQIVEELAQNLLEAWQTGTQVFICGNGGSAGNAIHLANDLVYGVGHGEVPGLRAHALPANAAVVTCLGNDRGFDQIFALQLRTLATAGDLLIVLSGSGNSANILEALAEAKALGMRSYAILGFSGGRAKAMADLALHFPVDDMQVAEDLQLVTGHMIVQWLMKSRVRLSV